MKTRRPRNIAAVYRFTFSSRYPKSLATGCLDRKLNFLLSDTRRGNSLCIVKLKKKSYSFPKRTGGPMEER